MNGRRPHFAWFFLALLPLAGGIALAVRFFLGMVDEIDSMKRIDMPGRETVHLAADDYIVFAENGQGRLRCTVTADDGAEIPLGSPTGKTTYTMGGHSGESLFELTAPREGDYTVACEGEEMTLAFGHGIGFTLVGMILAPIGGFLLAGLTVVLVYLWRRRRS